MSANPQSSETETAATLVAEYTRVDIMIPSKKKGVEISAWKFLPGGYQKGSKLPVVMGGVSRRELQKSPLLFFSLSFDSPADFPHFGPFLLVLERIDSSKV